MRSRVLRRARCAVLQVKDPRWGRAQPAGSHWHCSSLCWLQRSGSTQTSLVANTNASPKRDGVKRGIPVRPGARFSGSVCRVRATHFLSILFCTGFASTLRFIFQIRTSGEPGTIRGRGRRQEVYSEDPALTSALTVGYVTGIQGSQCVCRPALPPSPRVCDPRPSVCLPPVHVTCPLCCALPLRRVSRAARLGASGAFSFVRHGRSLQGSLRSCRNNRIPGICRAAQRRRHAPLAPKSRPPICIPGLFVFLPLPGKSAYLYVCPYLPRPLPPAWPCLALRRYNGTQKNRKYMQAGACCKHYVRPRVARRGFVLCGTTIQRYYDTRRGGHRVWWSPYKGKRGKEGPEQKGQDRQPR